MVGIYGRKKTPTLSGRGLVGGRLDRSRSGSRRTGPALATIGRGDILTKDVLDERLERLLEETVAHPLAPTGADGAGRVAASAPREAPRVFPRATC